ncbi:MAG: hypothetical protein MK116_03945 [Phycisphaerales bacterium]|nr:hypothetical protein [Phycisphaerales bacterium]
MTSILLAGCHSPSGGRLPDSATAEQEQSAGYTLLRELLDDEAQVDGILILKSASPETESLLKEIAVACVDMRGEIDDMARADDQVVLLNTGLPDIETSARARISSEMAGLLLGAESSEFELRILMTQEQAMGYGHHLAAALANAEDDSDRITVLERMAKDMKAFQERCLVLLRARCEVD